MPTNRRTEIVDYLVSRLKEIDGETSPFSGSYSFNTNIFNNVFRKLKFLDEVNDFPSIYLSAGTETRDFKSEGLTVATLDTIIRIYVYGQDNSQEQIDLLLQDVEHVIYSIGDNPDMGIQDITIQSISTGEGLAVPYGLAEVELLIVYRLEF